MGSNSGPEALGWVAWDVSALRKCLCNAHNALCNRHLVRQVDLTADLLPMTAAFVAATRTCLNDYAQHPFRDFDHWLLKWSSAKREQIRQSVINDIYRPDRVKSFVKWEISVGLKPPSKARLIQGPSNLRTQAELGPDILALQCVLGDHVHRLQLTPYVDITFACGMNVSKMALWPAFSERVVSYYERDGKTWDAMVQVKHFVLRDIIYRSFDAELADKVLKFVRVSGIVCDRTGFLSYKVNGTVKSGHNDTTLWNSILNALISAHVFTTLQCRASVIVAGDDMLAAVFDDYAAEQVRSLERACGIVPESRSFNSLYDASFVSAIWVTDGQHHGFIPKPGRILAKVWWSIRVPSPKRLRAHLNSIARGLWPSCNSVPVVSHWLRKAMGDYGTVDVGKDWWRDFSDVHQVFGEGIYRHFSTRYQISVNDLREAEKFLDGLEFRPGYVCHPVIQHIVEVDLADIGDRVVSFY